MKRRLKRSGYDSLSGSDEPNPMSGVSNLADVMLVLAVGIMLALIMNWRISINGGQVTQMKDGALTEVDSSAIHMGEQSEQEDGQQSNLKEKGTVYVDEATGKMYLVEPNGQ